MKPKFLILTTIFIFLVAFSNAQISIENKQISPNFQDFKGVLLIQSTTTLRGPTKVLEKRFRKFYKGEFQMVGGEDENAASVGSAKNFPFLLILAHSNHLPNADMYTLTMVDRTTGKKYETFQFADNTLPPYSTINKYAKALEELRGK